MSIFEALGVSIFGFAIVFFVLVSLSAVLKLQSALFSKFFSDLKGK